MKSLYHGTVAANAKLRGRLEHGLTCRCCRLYNWKWRERVREAKREIQSFGGIKAIDYKNQFADCDQLSMRYDAV